MENDTVVKSKLRRALQRYKMLKIKSSVDDIEQGKMAEIDKSVLAFLESYQQAQQLREKEVKERELPDTMPGSFILSRHPENIKIEVLHDKKFLIAKKQREAMLADVQELKKLHSRVASFKVVGDNEKFVYVDKNYEPFVGGVKTRLGNGNYGEVFAVQSVLTGKWHSLKKLRSGALTDSELDFLAAEGMLRTSERLPTYDLFISELICGDTLYAIMKEIKQKNLAFSFEEALALNISLVEAFESLQRKGYVHRDIKPDNIMFDRNQKKCFAIDFGFVRSVARNSKWRGSLKYSSPEAFSADFDDVKQLNLKDDIYAIGLVAGQIMGLAIDNMGVYEKLSLDTNKATKERYDYLKETYALMCPKLSTLQSFMRFYLEMFPVIFGSKDTEYQEDRKLSAEEIALCRLIYEMTQPIENRPDINAVLKEMRRIRLEHINKRMACFKSSFDNRSPDNYNDVLNEIYDIRLFLGNSPYMLDNIESFLLRAVDVNETNRSTVEELNQYLETLRETLEQKRTLNTEIKEHYLKRADNTERLAKKLQMLEKKLSIEAQTCLLGQENIKPSFQNSTLSSFAKTGKLTLQQRLPLLPKCPTLAERCLRYVE